MWSIVFDGLQTCQYFSPRSHTPHGNVFLEAPPRLSQLESCTHSFANLKLPPLPKAYCL